MKHVYANGTDWYIAHNLKDLGRVIEALTEYSIEDCDPFYQLPDDTSVPIWFEENDGEIDYKKKYLPKNAKIDYLPESKWGKRGYPFRVMATAREWCEVTKNGEMLGSTEA